MSIDLSMDLRSPPLAPLATPNVAELAALRTENGRLRDLVEKHCDFACRGGVVPASDVFIPTHSPASCLFAVGKLSDSLDRSVRRRNSSLSAALSEPRLPDILESSAIPTPTATPEERILELERANRILLDRAQEAQEKADEFKREADAMRLFIATTSHELR
jgi:signal transduction histidine kinase